MCAPVFDEFMKKATAKYGGGPFKVPPGGHFIKIDRYSGARLPDDATGNNVVAEYFRDGQEPIFGLGAMVDGGFAMGSDLPLYSRGEDATTEEVPPAQVTTSTGKKAVVAPKANFGTLSSGGLY
jgi:penicillin-binding protein 1A